MNCKIYNDEYIKYNFKEEFILFKRPIKNFRYSNSKLYNDSDI